MNFLWSVFLWKTCTCMKVHIWHWAKGTGRLGKLHYIISLGMRCEVHSGKASLCFLYGTGPLMDIWFLNCGTSIVIRLKLSQQEKVSTDRAVSALRPCLWHKEKDTGTLGLAHMNGQWGVCSFTFKWKLIQKPYTGTIAKPSVSTLWWKLPTSWQFICGAVLFPFLNFKKVAKEKLNRRERLSYFCLVSSSPAEKAQQTQAGSMINL